MKRRLLPLLLLSACAPTGDGPDAAAYDWPALDGWLDFDEGGGVAPDLPPDEPDGPFGVVGLADARGLALHQVLLDEDGLSLRPLDVVAEGARLRGGDGFLVILTTDLLIGNFGDGFSVVERDLPPGAGPLDLAPGEGCSCLVAHGSAMAMMVAEAGAPQFVPLSPHADADGDPDFTTATSLEGRWFLGLERRRDGLDGPPAEPGLVLELTCAGDEVIAREAGDAPRLVRAPRGAPAAWIRTAGDGGDELRALQADGDPLGPVVHAAADGPLQAAVTGPGGELWFAVGTEDGAELRCAPPGGEAEGVGEVGAAVLDVAVVPDSGPLWLLDDERVLLLPAEGCAPGEPIDLDLPAPGLELEAVGLRD